MQTRVIVGLGNPGSEYDGTRHNIGFDYIDCLHEHFRFPDFIAKDDLAISKSKINGCDVILAKPLSYMNNSGIPVSKYIRFYKLDPCNVTVIHDEIELETARCKMKLGGGNAGHNGLKSLDTYLGASYHKVRVGVGRPSIKGMSVSSYVLGKFTEGERDKLQDLRGFIIDSMPEILLYNIEKFNNKAGQFFKNNIVTKG